MHCTPFDNSFHRFQRCWAISCTSYIEIRLDMNAWKWERSQICIATNDIVDGFVRQFPTHEQILNRLDAVIQNKSASSSACPSLCFTFFWRTFYALISSQYTCKYLGILFASLTWLVMHRIAELWTNNYMTPQIGLMDFIRSWRTVYYPLMRFFVPYSFHLIGSHTRRWAHLLEIELDSLCVTQRRGKTKWLLQCHIESYTPNDCLSFFLCCLFRWFYFSLN